MSTPTAPHLRVVQDAQTEDRGVDQPLVPEGIYRAVFVRYETVQMRMFGGAPKVFVHFRLVDPGSAFGVVIYRCYRAKALASKLGRYGSFRLGRRSELFLALSALTTAKLRPDRLSVKELLRGRVLRVKVRTVRVDYKGRPLPAALHYSTVSDIEGADTETAERSPALSSEQ